MQIRLEQNWKFHRGDIVSGEAPSPQYGIKSGFTWGAANPDAPDELWQTVELPHDWSIDGQPEPWNQTPQGFWPRGISWYRGYFDLPQGAEDKKVYLEFEGISGHASFWINGFRMGTHARSCVPVLLDITAVVPRTFQRERPDEVLTHGGRNVIAVKVDARESQGWYYEGAGIYRPVTLHVLDHLHFVWNGVFWQTPTVSAHAAKYLVSAEVRNEHLVTRHAGLRVTVQDTDGRTVAQERTNPVSLPPGGTSTLSTAGQILMPKLWSPETPYLYRLRVELIADGQTLDVYDAHVGVRWYSWDANRGFFLNGEPYKLNGVCCHEDFAGVGVALPSDLHAKRVGLMKSLGSNAFRSAHNPSATAFLKACDQLGMLVLDENRFLEVAEENLTDLRNLVRRDRNHPSVFMWGLCNEEYQSTRPTGARLLRTLHQLVKEEDPTRPTTAAMCFGRNVDVHADFWRAIDVIGRNYDPSLYATDHLRYPEMVMVATEFGSLCDSRDVYLARNDYSSLYDRPEGNDPAKAPCYEQVWRPIAEQEFVAGGFIWSGMDYRGEPTPHQWPNTIAQYGLLDLCGFRKDGAWYFEAAWKDTPVLHLFPHWTWPGREEQPLRVCAYTNCEEVELWVNDVCVGRQAARPLSMLEWSVTYVPGHLEVRGFRGGREVRRDVRVTAGPLAGLRVEADRPRLAANGHDVACVAVSGIDAAGTLVPEANACLTFAVDGAGSLLGLGNGDPQCHMPEKSNKRPLFRGRCLAVVQAGRQAGRLTLTVSGTGVDPVSLIILVE